MTKTTNAAPVRQKLSVWGRHPFVIPVTTFLVLFFASLVLFVHAGGTTIGATDTRIVRLTIDNNEQILPTRAQSVGELLQRLDIQLQPKDIVVPDQDTQIQDNNFQITIHKARPVQVVSDNFNEVVYTAEPSLVEVAKQAGLKVFPEDKLLSVPVTSLNANDVLRDGVVAERLIVEPATETKLHLYGAVISLRTHAQTVGDLLAERQVQLNEGDTVEPALEMPLAVGTEVFVVRIGQQVVQVEEAIEPPTEFVDDFDLVLGSTTVREPGKAGKRIVTYEITQENGAEVSRRVIQQIVAEQPVKRVVARGRKAPVVAGNKAEIMAAAGIPSSQFFAADFIIAHESGWRVNALNSRGCAGLGQACPGSKLAAVCPAWQTDPVCQMRFFDNYARSRYGSWSAAYDVWQRQRWW